MSLVKFPKVHKRVGEPDSRGKWVGQTDYDETHPTWADLFQSSHSYLSTIMPEKSNHDALLSIVKLSIRYLLRSMITLMSEVFEQSLRASLWLNLLILTKILIGGLFLEIDALLVQAAAMWEPRFK